VAGRDVLDISYESFAGVGLIEMTTETLNALLNDEAAAGIREMIVIVLTD
jgi:hypothetical protein